MRKRWIVLGIAVLALAATYWFATGGIPSREPAEWLTNHAIAHRGRWAPGSARPENSLAAFEAAAGSGNPVELDVQLSSDGSVVVFHDDDVERMTEGRGLVSEIPLAELQRLHLLGGEQTVPTLRQALDTVAGRVPVFVEVKNRGEVGDLEEQVARQLSRYAGEAAVMSFNPYSLAQVAKTEPSIQRGQLASAFKGEDLAFYEVLLLRNMMMNWSSRPDFIAYDLTELPSLGTSLQRWRGRPLIGWTAEDPQDVKAAEKMCDAVICNPGALAR